MKNQGEGVTRFHTNSSKFLVTKKSKSGHSGSNNRVSKCNRFEIEILRRFRNRLGLIIKHIKFNQMVDTGLTKHIFNWFSNISFTPESHYELQRDE